MGLQNGRGAASEVLRLLTRLTGEGEKVLAMLKLGREGTTCFGVVLTLELVILAILKGAHNFHPLKEEKGLGGRKMFRTRNCLTL